MTVLETVTRGVGQVLPSAFADQITFLSSYGTGTNNSDTGIAQIQIIIWLHPRPGVNMGRGFNL